MRGGELLLKKKIMTCGHWAHLESYVVSASFPNPALLAAAVAGLPFAASPKNRLCLGHNSPLARPLDIPLCIIVDVTITWPIIFI